MSTVKEQIDAAWEKYQEQKKDELYPNIMLLGPSGAGKSSLINKIFGGELAAVSHVAPETKENKIYWGKDSGQTINLVDTAGYELGQGDTYCDRVIQSIAEGIGGEPIHIVWYCVPVVNERVQDMDTNILKRLNQETKIKKRICVVFTKCDKDTENSDKANALKCEIDKRIDFSIESFETSSAKGFNMELDLPRLIQWSADNISDEELRENFVAAQMLDLNLKRDEAKKIYKSAALFAAGIGAVPLGFPDSAALIPTQVMMAAKIIDVYGVSNLAKFSTLAIGDVTISNMGKWLASSIIKAIPGIGSIVSAVIAGSITTALGAAVSEICYRNIEAYLNGKTVIWEKMFATDEFFNLLRASLEAKGIETGQLLLEDNHEG